MIQFVERKLISKNEKLFIVFWETFYSFVKKLHWEKVWKDGGLKPMSRVGMYPFWSRILLVCFLKKVHSTFELQCNVQRVWLFGMTTHMAQQITWANNRVPLLCQHRSYFAFTTKCLWSSWYHLEMGGTTWEGTWH